MRALRPARARVDLRAVAAIAVVVGVLGVILVLPIGAVFFGAITSDSAYGARVLATLAAPATRRVVAFTVSQAVVSAGISVVLAVPVAYAVSHYHFPGRRLFYSLSIVPFVLPSIVVVICVISFYGRAGLINRLFGTDWNLVYNPVGIVIAHVFFNFSLAVRILADGWSRIDSRLYDSARTLGSRSRGVFARVAFPLVLPSIGTAFLLIFIYCFFSFGVVLVFGGIRYTTLEVETYSRMFVRLDVSTASVYALLQLIVSLCAVVVMNRVVFRTERHGRSVVRRRRPLAASNARWFLIVYGVLVLVFLGGPIVTMTARAFGSPDGFSTRNFRVLFQPGPRDWETESVAGAPVARIITTSLSLAGVSGTVTFALALMTALVLKRRRTAVLEALVTAPMCVSIVTVAIGMRLVFAGIVPDIVLVVLAQTVLGFPFVFRIADTTLSALPDSYADAARSLGASRFAAVRDVVIPLVSRGLLNAYAYAVAIALADFTAVFTLGRGNIVTFPVAIYRLIGFRGFDRALALGVIYIVICSVVFVWVDRTSGRDIDRGRGDTVDYA